jgi:hypothetical protein
MSEERDTRSYSERYAPPEPPPPPRPSSGSLDGRLLALIGVGLLAAAGVAALVLRGPGSQRVTTAQATPSPSATLTASLGPTPTPDPGVLALHRFWTLIGDAELSYHLETTGGGRIGEEAYSFRESLDVAGDAWKGSEQAHGLGYVSAVQLVVLDTVVWIKGGFGGTWNRSIDHDPYWRARPLLDLESILALTPSGTVAKGGTTLYVLKANTNYQPYPGRLIGFASMGNLKVDTIELTVLVTGDGVPVEADVHILAGDLDAKGKADVDAKATRLFTKVGAKFTITAPKP